VDFSVSFLSGAEQQAQVRRDTSRDVLCSALKEKVGAVYGESRVEVTAFRSFFSILGMAALRLHSLIQDRAGGAVRLGA
jgi:hypothetical protein